MAKIDRPNGALARNVRRIGHYDLPGAGQVIMPNTPHVAGERAIRSVDFGHHSFSTVAPEVFTIADYFSASPRRARVGHLPLSFRSLFNCN